MTDAMRKAYEDAGELKYYFDREVPVDLWRGLKKDEYENREKQHRATTGAKPPANLARDVSVEPVTKGFWLDTKQTRWRAPDVEVITRNGEEWIRGCRSTRKGGQHWGISLWDRQPAFAARGGWLNFRVPAGTAIPESLAVTQDDDYTGRPNHYTIAPKDDMPLGLYVVWLKAMAEHFTSW